MGMEDGVEPCSFPSSLAIKPLEKAMQWATRLLHAWEDMGGGWCPVLFLVCHSSSAPYSSPETGRGGERMSRWLGGYLWYPEATAGNWTDALKGEQWWEALLASQSFLSSPS